MVVSSSHAGVVLISIVPPDGPGVGEGRPMLRWNRGAKLMLLGALLVPGCGGERRVDAGDPAAASPAPAAVAPEPAAPGPAPVAHDASADPAFETSLAPLHDVELLARAA